jgi:hypothetical protein
MSKTPEKLASGSRTYVGEVVIARPAGNPQGGVCFVRRLNNARTGYETGFLHFHGDPSTYSGKRIEFCLERDGRVHSAKVIADTN